MPLPLTRRQLLGGGVLLAAGWTCAHLVGHRPLGPLPSPYLGPGPRRTLEAVLEVWIPVPERASVVAEGIDGFLAAGDPVLSEQLRLALVVLEHLGGAGPLAFRRFSRRPPEERLAVLDAWLTSALGPKRQIAAALRKVALFSWYSRPESWEAIGYDGPWVTR